MAKQFLVEVQDEQIPITLSKGKLSISGKSTCISLLELRTNVYSLLLNGHSHLVYMENEPDALLTINGETVKSRIISEREQLIQRYDQQAGKQAATTELRAPMPGLIIKIMTKAGDHVDKGQGLIVLEAMKMENELCAPSAGIVRHVYVQEKDAVTNDALLIEFES